MAVTTRHHLLTVVELDPIHRAGEELRELNTQLLALVDECDPPRILLDFQRTDFIDSSFLELVVRCWKRLAQRRGELYLCSIGETCATVFSVTNLDRLWTTYSSRDDAVASLCPTIPIVEIDQQYSSIDHGCVDDVARMIDQVGNTRFVIDMSHVEQVGSRFLGLLVRVSNDLQKTGGRFVLCSLQPTCAEVLKAARLERLCDICGTRDEAVAMLGAGQRA